MLVSCTIVRKFRRGGLIIWCHNQRMYCDGRSSHAIPYSVELAGRARQLGGSASYMGCAVCGVVVKSMSICLRWMNGRGGCRVRRWAWRDKYFLIDICKYICIASLMRLLVERFSLHSLPWLLYSSGTLECFGEFNSPNLAICSDHTC